MSELHPDIVAVLEGRSRYCVIEGDCLPILASMPDKSVDHVITDPPYNERTHARARSLKDGGSDIPINFKHLESFEFANDLVRIARRWVLAFCALEDLGAYSRAVSDDAWVRGGIWDRPDGTPQISGDRPGQGAEGIAIMHGASKKRWARGGKRGVWRCGIERIQRYHPTPKPPELMLELVDDFTDSGDVILDPFAGGGTTWLAALRRGRRAILIEENAGHASTIRDRLAAECAGSTLAAHRAGQVPMFGTK